jgi:hypothetical protein
MYASTQCRTEYTTSITELKMLLSKTDEKSIKDELTELIEDYSNHDGIVTDDFDDDTLWINDEEISGELATFFNENADARDWE